MMNNNITKEILIHKTFDYLNRLPQDKVIEVAEFVEFLYQKHEEYILKKGIQKMVTDSKSFEFLKEEEELYTLDDLKVRFIMNKGEIILVTFPFTDLSGSKLRPALVLAADRDDVTVAFITTNLQQVNNTDMFVQKSTTNGLKKDSIVKLNKIATLDYSLIMGSVGLLVENELKEVDRKLLLIFNIKES